MKILKINKWHLLTSAIILISLILIVNYTESKESWRYEIRGYVNNNGQQHEAVWYTDSIQYGDNYLRYENSDGTEVIIPAPFVLIDFKYDSIEINNKNGFR